MTTPSQVPVPSEKPQDLLFNAGKIDEFVNSVINQYIDRFGAAHLTIAGITALARTVIEQIKADGADAVSAIGWQELGDWAVNLTINNRDQVVWYDNAWYKYIGSLPHTIAGSSPATDGGIWSDSNPNGKWVNIGDASLRSFLRTQAGASNVMTESQLSTQAELDLLNAASKTDPYKKVYLTFIDDDTRAETYTYWGRLATEMGVKITLAVVPNWVNGNYPAGKTAMTLAQLREMYDAGHDLVSHGYDTLTIQDYLDNPSVLYTQLHDARQWLIDKGFTRDHGYNNFVWPQGLGGDDLKQSRAKSEVRKYYKYAVNAFTNATSIPRGVFDSYNMPRATGDGKTPAQLISMLDSAIANNGWMIVLSHAWHAVDQDGGDYDRWSPRYRDLINYARANNVEIVTLSQGLKVKGNALSFGEWLDAPRCNYVNNDGTVFPGGMSMVVSKSTDDSIYPVTMYQQPSTTKIFLQTAHDTVTGQGGIITVTRGYPYFSFREYTPINRNYVLKSLWSETTNSWQQWVCIANANGTSNLTGNQTIAAATATKILFNSTPSQADDNLLAFDPPNSRFVATFAANIRMNVRVGTQSAPPAGSHISLNLYRNGSLHRILYQGTQGIDGPIGISGSAAVSVAKGDIIEIWITAKVGMTIASSPAYTTWQYAI